jgi:hypothetical protein
VSAGAADPDPAGIMRGRDVSAGGQVGLFTLLTS